MRVIELLPPESVYSCRSYLLLGDWNALGDVNTLIDPGSDGATIIRQVESIPTGCGKIPVEQIILTHNHFDHAAGVEEVKRRYGCIVRAFADGPAVDLLLHDGEQVAAADDFLQVIHVPNHSSDSVCLFNHRHRVLFSGDTQLRILTAEGEYPPGYGESLRRIASLMPETVYPGHDHPVRRGVHDMLQESIRNVMAAARDGGAREGQGRQGHGTQKG